VSALFHSVSQMSCPYPAMLEWWESTPDIPIESLLIVTIIIFFVGSLYLFRKI